MGGLLVSQLSDRVLQARDGVSRKNRFNMIKSLVMLGALVWIHMRLITKRAYLSRLQDGTESAPSKIVRKPRKDWQEMRKWSFQALLSLFKIPQSPCVI